MDKTMHMALKKHREGKMNIDRLLADEDERGGSSERMNEDRNLEEQKGSDLAPTLKREDGMHDYDKEVPEEHDKIPGMEGLEGDKGIPPIDIKELLGSEGGSGLRKHAMLAHDVKDAKGNEEASEEEKKKSRFHKMKGLFQTNKYE